MESSDPRETRILGVMLVATAVLLGLITWWAGTVLTDLPRLQTDGAVHLELG